jgi:hypothetical protein
MKNIKDTDLGIDPTGSACKNGHLHIVKFLIKHQKFIWKDSLYRAGMSGNLELIDFLLDYGATHKLKSDFNGLLRGICCYGDIDKVNKIIKYGRDYGYEFDWNCGLSGACRGGEFKIVQMMLNLGANDFNTGLTGACIGTKDEIGQFMISKGAKWCACCDSPSDDHNHTEREVCLYSGWINE